MYSLRSILIDAGLVHHMRLARYGAAQLKVTRGSMMQVMV
jgi:hypothetical protein